MAIPETLRKAEGSETLTVSRRSCHGGIMENLAFFLFAFAIVALLASLLLNRQERPPTPVVITMSTPEPTGSGCLPLILLILAILVLFTLLGSQ